MKKGYLLVIIAAAMVFSMILGMCPDSTPKTPKSTSESFRLLVCTENRDMEDVLRYFCKDNNISIQIEYRNIFDTVKALNMTDCQFDGVWLSDSVWLNMVSKSNTITNIKSVSVNPVVFAVRKSKAQQLGFAAGKVSMSDLADRIKKGDLTFALPSPTKSNIGIMAYLRFFYNAADNPQSLNLRHLKDNRILSSMMMFLRDIEHIQVSDENLIETFISGSYDAAAGYEFEFIALNKKLTEQGKEPVLLIYPSEGVFLCDSPFAYIDQGDSGKAEIFSRLQSFLLSEEMQKEMAQSGRRTGYGGQNPYGSEAVFSPEWGISKNAYLAQVSIPSAEVITQSMELFHTRLRKPSVTVFCLDTTMGWYDEFAKNLTFFDTEIIFFMENIIKPERANTDSIQFFDDDIIYLLPFGAKTDKPLKAAGNENDKIIDIVYRIIPDHYGVKETDTSDLYEVLLQSLAILKDYSSREYILTVVLFTDEADYDEKYPDRSAELAKSFGSSPDTKVLIISPDNYSSSSRYEEIINAVNGKFFHSKEDRTAALQEIRRYNVSEQED